MLGLFKKDLITFTADGQIIDLLTPPLRASKKIPKWYKSLKPTTGKRDKAGFPEPTAKKCMPVLDAMTTGYLLTTTADIHVITNHDCSVIKIQDMVYNNVLPTVDRHGSAQVRSKDWPLFNQDPIKFLNYWQITTRKGYSCYFCPPSNNFDAPFECISAVVDTDNYANLINFPAVWRQPNFDDLIPVGTPIVQIIPFKREKYPEVITRKYTEKEQKAKQLLSDKLHTRARVYKEECRSDR